MSLLEEGSLVIPKKVVMYLNDYKGKYTCGKHIKDESKLIPTVVMPDEIIVCSHYAGDVERFLKKKGIRLPISDDNFI